MKYDAKKISQTNAQQWISLFWTVGSIFISRIFKISFFLQDYSTEKMCRLRQKSKKTEMDREEGKDSKCCFTKNRFMTVLKLVLRKVLDHSSSSGGN